MYDETQIRSFASPLSDFLKSLGYSEKPVSRTTRLNYYAIEYVNDAISRTITFLLDDQQISFSLFVRCDKENFSLSNFSEHKKLTDPCSSMIPNLLTKRPLTEAEFRYALTSVLEFLKQHLMDIITGQRWETIPMDWGPYR